MQRRAIEGSAPMGVEEQGVAYGNVGGAAGNCLALRSVPPKRGLRSRSACPLRFPALTAIAIWHRIKMPIGIETSCTQPHYW
jgi:hypothetical protein